MRNVNTNKCKVLTVKLSIPSGWFLSYLKCRHKCIVYTVPIATVIMNGGLIRVLRGSVSWPTCSD